MARPPLPRRFKIRYWMLSFAAGLGAMVMLAAPAAAPPHPSGTGLSPQTAVTQLSIEQRFSLLEVPVGGRTIVTVTITNSGAVAASGVAVRSILPTGLVHLASTPTGDVQNQVISWSLGSIAAGESRTIDVTLRATSAGTLTHGVSVRSDLTEENEHNAVITITPSGLSPNVEQQTGAPLPQSDGTPMSATIDGELARTGATLNWLFAGALALVAVGAFVLEASSRLPAMATLTGVRPRRRRRSNRSVFHPVRS